MDENGTVMLPVKGGKWFTEMSMGRNIENYESLLVLTHSTALNARGKS